MTTNDAPTYEWHITVRKLDHYGQKVKKTYPATVIASTRSEVTTKVRAMFEATYDDFRKFWSHDWTLQDVCELQPRPAPRYLPSEDQPAREPAPLDPVRHG